ncbi:hypothetical protein ACFLQI_01325 [Candidatus Undinarchaeota archaeon]
MEISAKLKTTLIYFGILLSSLIISIFLHGGAPTEETGTILEITGLLYGLLAAFMITNAWDGFVNLREKNADELSSLANAFQSTLFTFKNCSMTRHLYKTISKYSEMGLETEWSDYWKLESIFSDIYSVVGQFKDKEQAIVEDICDYLAQAQESRTNLLILSEMKVITSSEWGLLIFLSVSIIGMLLYTGTGLLASIITNAILIAAVLIVLWVAYELDMYKWMEHEVSEEPDLRLQRILDADMKRVLGAKIQSKLRAEVEKDVKEHLNSEEYKDLVRIEKAERKRLKSLS